MKQKSEDETISDGHSHSVTSIVVRALASMDPPFQHELRHLKASLLHGGITFHKKSYLFRYLFNRPPFSTSEVFARRLHKEDYVFQSLQERLKDFFSMIKGK